ncbi:GNAT family N-acetyltransferase [Phaeobacter porticola]|uniref:GNAT family N-acetyltransferase n=1 Tax=Phaeobacter porticola TaxID=1844006 RepID=UPI001F457F73|nr:GNAT family N-acetyltransferase [Phaeobacter porticola]
MTLRPLRAGDATDLHRFFSDPVAMQYFDTPHRDIAQSEAWLTGTLRAPLSDTREYALVRDGCVIGKAGIWKAPELGFFLERAAWGQGLMREALEVLIPHLFTTMNLPHMLADVDPDNAASLMLLRGLGFVETHRAARTIQISGKWCDSVYLHLAS